MGQDTLQSPHTLMMALTDQLVVIPTVQMRLLRLRYIRGCSKVRSRGGRRGLACKFQNRPMSHIRYCQEAVGGGQGLDINDTGDNVGAHACSCTT